MSDMVDKSPKVTRKGETTKGKHIKKNLEGFGQYLQPPKLPIKETDL